MLWPKLITVLLQEGSSCINTKLCDQSTPQISTSHPKRAQYAPHKWTRPNYGATKQLATPLDTSPPIPEERKRRIQQSIGIFLYYARAVDCTMLPALNTLAAQQSSTTKNTESASFDTSQHPSSQVYGGTKIAPFNFHW